MSEFLLNLYGPTLKTADVASVLHCHPAHVRQLCQRGELPAIRIGGRWHIITRKLGAMLDGEADDGR